MVYYYDFDTIVSVVFREICEVHFDNGDPKKDTELAVTKRRWKEKQIDLKEGIKKCYILDWIPFASKEDPVEDLVHLRFRNAISPYQKLPGLPLETVILHQRATFAFIQIFCEKQVNQAESASEKCSNAEFLKFMYIVWQGFYSECPYKDLVMKKYPIAFLNFFIKCQFDYKTCREFLFSPEVKRPDYQPSPSKELLELVEIVHGALSCEEGACHVQ